MARVYDRTGSMAGGNKMSQRKTSSILKQGRGPVALKKKQSVAKKSSGSSSGGKLLRVATPRVSASKKSSGGSGRIEVPTTPKRRR